MDYPLTFNLGAQNIRAIIQRYPETLGIFEAFNHGVMSWASALTLVIEVIAAYNEVISIQLEEVTKPFEPNMN